MNKKGLSLLVSLSLTFSLLPNVAFATTNSETTQNSEGQILQKFKSLNGDKLKYDVDSSNGKVFVSGNLSPKSIKNNSDALNFVDENKALLNLNNVKDNIKVEKSEKDSLGFTHVKMAQYIDGLPIKDKNIILHYNKNGQATNITGEVENKISTISSLGDKSLTENDAVEIAKKEFTYNKLAYDPKVETIAYIKDGQAYKTYKVNIKFYEPKITNYDVYVEATSGTILRKEDNIRYDGATTGTGIAVDGSTKPLNIYLSSGKYQLKDTSKASSGSQILTYTADNRQVEPGTLISNSSSTFNTTKLKAAVSAHYFAGVVYDFYKDLFGRNSIDNNGMNLVSTVHYDSNYNNAFWDGSQMVYGDGDGTTFTYLSGDLDVVGHEMTHGITERTANLNYEDQSGALNESMSDVLGVLIQTYDRYSVKNGGTWTFKDSDWVVGDDVYTPNTPGDALRSLANPTLYDQPDNMSNYVNTSSDNGGVHTNSGIPNKAAYLVSKSIGNEKTAKIYYRGLTEYMTSTTNFLGARNALVQAATDLYGSDSAEVSAVNDSFSTVGVGSSSSTVKVTGISLDKTSATIGIGSAVTLTPTITPSNATNKSVTWSTSNSNVATISNGIVTGKTAGTATITATTVDGSKSTSATITVSDNTTPSTTSINEGFDKLIGTSSSIISGIPTGWNFSSGLGVYTTNGNYGKSAPSLKFLSDGSRLTTPTFNLSKNATLSFWLKGNSTLLSDLLIEEFDGTNWSTVADLSNLPTTGTTKTYTLDSSTKQIRFTFSKFWGNLALDDIKIQ
ncbi:M4 family metallopeptidase [Clostridium sp. SHJSY1]|uniref:M4 family metallopeptidase n=1 Tax=Clostridium sp. SHJSY1 TaxID=2942483 RepID=UPI0028740D56|nr:M4 family metallopeptidase [Clostridium sp. SHJSY1]MDS0527985.1 M4 family metallopeptidase [Clostridium sp. SHJSY1]